MCSRKYNIWLCLKYILGDVLLMNRAKTTAGPPSFAPLCSLSKNKHMSSRWKLQREVGEGRRRFYAKM